MKRQAFSKHMSFSGTSGPLQWISLKAFSGPSKWSTSADQLWEHAESKRGRNPSNRSRTGGWAPSSGYKLTARSCSNTGQRSSFLRLCAAKDNCEGENASGSFKRAGVKSVPADRKQALPFSRLRKLTARAEQEGTADVGNCASRLTFEATGRDAERVARWS
ncbi:hypothetical protein S40285_10021 [Stachybotrys chlorohalonatus IBT 40285]|uniref:Uncharacterized protein n=1 Tax=Stachybotrys chlorohalonatus (strain IBT 40285) TaxID=1283841 RepID=A0A084QXN0_STAC4|nr:hypothetical protein S40285_10021 [Stachybotrys chlorohalonata IBT 40285]